MSLSTFPLSSKEVFRRRSDLFFDPSSPPLLVSQSAEPPLTLSN